MLQAQFGCSLQLYNLRIGDSLMNDCQSPVSSSLVTLKNRQQPSDQLVVTSLVVKLRLPVKLRSNHQTSGKLKAQFTLLVS